MRLLPFTFFTALGAGMWSAILALVGYALGRQTADITYLELIMRGKEMATAQLPYVIAGAVTLALLAYIAKRLIEKLIVKLH